MNEQIYDNEIAPKLKEVGELCLKHGIPFLAIAEYAQGMIGETAVQSKDECLKMVMIRHCTKTAPNIDAFVIGLIRWAKENNINMGASIVMRQLLANHSMQATSNPIGQ